MIHKVVSKGVSNGFILKS